MPKIVNHDRRREQIIEAVWSLIARKGFFAVTMRELADEAGYANGALGRYFPDKESILRAAFYRAFDATNDRARAAIGDREGLEAFRLLVLEIMPLDEVRLLEARVVIGFWDWAAGDAELVEVFQSALDEWRALMTTYLSQAYAAGDIATDDYEGVIDQIMALTMGLQINAWFLPKHTTPERQLAMLDNFLLGLQQKGDAP